MKLRFFLYRVLLLSATLFFGLTSGAWATCTGADMSIGGYCLFQGGFGVIGGAMDGASCDLTAANMYPFQKRNDLKEYYDKAVGYYTDGSTFRNTLLLMDKVPNSTTPQGKMLIEPKLNYESVIPALVTDPIMTDIYNKLSFARDTFVYSLDQKYPDEATARYQLLETIKLMANIYLMIGDEFLIDALEYRFSSSTLDGKLSEQIALLNKAQSYYQKALMSFVSGFSPAVVGTSIYASDAFDDAVFSLFNLSLERLGMTMREKSSKELARQMTPDSTEEWTAARNKGLGIIKDISATLYLSAATVADRAQKTGMDFNNDLGGDKLTAAIMAVARQGNVYNSGFNPLGYDNRYVPMDTFEKFYALANGSLDLAKNAENNFKDQNRAFDADVLALSSQLVSLNERYVGQLASLTGCNVPANPDDPAEIDAFIECTGEAGGDLFDCSLDLSPEEFETCLAGKPTKGVLASKYRNIKDAQTRLDQARLRRTNILEKINIQVDLHKETIRLKRSQLGEQTSLLDEYYEKLKNARTETDTVTYTSVRERKDGKWKKVSKERHHSTTETFTIRDDNLQLNTEKEKELLRLTTEYEILQADLQTAATVKDLLLSEAEAEIDIDLAALQKNSALADFDNTLIDKDNQWFFYQQAISQLTYYTERIPTQRLLRSQECLALSEALYSTAHYAYLAAKAVEMKYLNPVVNLSGIGAVEFGITDLFKAQTPGEIEKFLNNLNAYNSGNCPWGEIDHEYFTVSLKNDILGLRGLPADIQMQQFRAFIGEHTNAQGVLEFTFTLSEENSFLYSNGLFNIKIWNGPEPASCSSPLTAPVRGVTVGVNITQADVRPRIRLKRTGHSSFRNATGDIRSYIPIYDVFMLPKLPDPGSTTITPSKTADFYAFVSIDPRTQTGITGSWTNAFHGWGLSSSDWSLTLYDNTLKTQTSKINDITIYIDTIRQCCIQ